MKKIIVLSLVLLSNYVGNAQESAIRVNPFALLWGSDLVSYERAITDNSSGIVGIGIGGYNMGTAKYSNTGAELQYRYYFDEVLNGWYAGGLAAYTSGKVTIDDTPIITGSKVTFAESETTFTSLRLGAKGGYQWIWNSGFLLDVNLGMAYTKFDYADSDGTFASLKGSGVLPSGSIAIGYSF